MDTAKVFKDDHADMEVYIEETPGSDMPARVQVGNDEWELKTPDEFDKWADDWIRVLQASKEHFRKVRRDT